MFASFLAVDEIVIAALDPARDPVNAAILNRNANLLANVKVDGKPLKVHRLMLPPRNNKSWSAFSNIIIANDVILMPIYDTDPKQMVEAGVAMLKKVRPECTVETIDISTFRELQGELHCLSMHIPAFAPMPKGMTSFEAAGKAGH